MSKLINKKVLKDFRWQNFLGLTVAGIINAIGVTLFLAPIKLYDSGISGTSMLLAYVANNPFLSLSVFLIILNLPFYIIGLKKQGFVFTVYSLYAIAIYSSVAYIIQNFLPIDFSIGSPIAGGDFLLCAIFGGIISGVGSGVTIRFGGAIDGIEVMAILFAKYIGLTVGTFVMIYNSILYVICGLVMGSWTIPLYSIITYMVGLKAVDFVVEGFDRAKAAVIITNKKDEVANKISANMGRGITILDAQGYYSKEKKAFIYVVVNRFQIGKLKKIVSAVDPMAFVTIMLVADTLRQSVKTKNKRRKDNDKLPSNIHVVINGEDCVVETDREYAENSYNGELTDDINVRDSSKYEVNNSGEERKACETVTDVDEKLDR